MDNPFLYALLTTVGVCTGIGVVGFLVILGINFTHAKATKEE